MRRKEQLTYEGYFLGFLYMQILHYNNDFEIDVFKKLVRARNDSYTYAFFPKINLEIETHSQTLFFHSNSFPSLIS